MTKILIVDDDSAIATLVSDVLEDEGYQTLSVQDGKKALKIIEEEPDLDLILLDIMMPEMNGLELCKKVRDDVKCPIIFMTAKNRTLDTVVGFELGADDYITKPFVVDELLARVKAHLRREKRNLVTQQDQVIKLDDIRIDKESFEVYKNGVLIDLTPREFQLLLFLVEHIGKVLTREQIFTSVWGVDYGDIGTVNVNIKNLRTKFDPENRYIKTIWGVGYKFVRNQGEQ